MIPTADELRGRYPSPDEWRADLAIRDRDLARSAIDAIRLIRNRSELELVKAVIEFRLQARRDA